MEYGFVRKPIGWLISFIIPKRLLTYKVLSAMRFLINTRKFISLLEIQETFP